MAQRQEERAAPAPSQTQTETTQPQTQTPTPRILRLRGARTSSSRGVQWADDVVDNEGLGRKSSKVCCIYHKPKAVDESSDESSSSSDEDSEDEKHDADKKGKEHACRHGHGHGRGRQTNGDGKKVERRPSPNAYEKVPKVKSKAGEGGMKS